MESHHIWQSRKTRVGKGGLLMVNRELEFARTIAGKEKKKGRRRLKGRHTNPETRRAMTRQAAGTRGEEINWAMKAQRRTKIRHELHDLCKVDLIGLILQITQETTGPDREGIKTAVKNIGPEGIEPTPVQNGESPRSESKGKTIKQRKLGQAKEIKHGV
jgi:hypothetical protein